MRASKETKKPIIIARDLTADRINGNTDLNLKVMVI